MTLTANDFLANFGELLRCKRCKLSSSILIQKILTKLHLHILTSSGRENTTCFPELVQLCLTRRVLVLNFSIVKSLFLIVVVHEAIFFILCMHFQRSTRPPIIICISSPSSSTLPGVKYDRAEPWAWLLHLLLPKNPPENKNIIRDGGCAAL